MQAASQPLASEVGLLSLLLRGELSEGMIMPEDASSILLSWLQGGLLQVYKFSMGKSDSKMERWAVSHALHELRKETAHNINAPVQLRGTTVPHLKNTGSILPSYRSVLLLVSIKLFHHCFTPEPVVGLPKVSAAEIHSQVH